MYQISVFALNFIALLYLKKSAAEIYRTLVETYGNNALSDKMCIDWLRRFKNSDFELEDKECSGATKKFDEKHFMKLFDHGP